MWCPARTGRARYSCFPAGTSSTEVGSGEIAAIPVQYIEHAPTGRPFLLPPQSLQGPIGCVSLKEIVAIFPVIDDMSIPLPAGPIARARISSIADRRLKTADIMKERYQFAI